MSETSGGRSTLQGGPVVSMDEEERFQADLAAAMALSLETLAVENIRWQPDPQEQRRNSLRSGRSERSPSVTEDVITTQVCPRSRPEVKKIDIPSVLPPPPSLEKRRVQSVDNSGLKMGERPQSNLQAGRGTQDLISFVSPVGKGKEGGDARLDLESLNWDNNNSDVQQQQLKAVQKLFSQTQPGETARPPPQPFPRNSLPGLGGYPTNHSMSVNNHLSNNRAVALATNQTMTVNNQLPNPLYRPGSLHQAYIPRPSPYFISQQSLFNQTVGRPVQNSTLSQPVFQGIPTPSSSMVKSSSWNEDMKVSRVQQVPTKPPQHISPPPSVRSIKTSSSAQSLDSGAAKRPSVLVKAQTDSLIDLNLSTELDEGDDVGNTTVSILQDFDPLAEAEQEEEIYWSSRKSNFSESFYDTTDPFSYMEQKAELSERIREVEDDTDSSPPPAIPRRRVEIVRPTSVASEDTILRRKLTARNYENIVKKDTKIFECMEVERKPAAAIDGDILSFIDMVRSVRRSFVCTDEESNPGLVTALKLEASYPANTEVKLSVCHLGNHEKPVQFTASIETEVDVIMAQVLVEEEMAECVLKVRGQAEYLSGGRLSDYEYVHHCYKYNRDVSFTLVPKEGLVRPLARTQMDDERDFEVGYSEISPLDSMKTLSYSELQILLQTLQKEADRMCSTARTLASCSDTGVLPALRPKQMLQAVKMVCALLGGVESLEVREACEQLINTCMQFDKAKGNEDPTGRLRPEIVDEVGERYAMVALAKAKGVNYDQHADDIDNCLKTIKTVVETLIKTYARTFRVDFQLELAPDLTPAEVRPTTVVRETLLVRVCCVHRLDQNWTFKDYRLDLRIYHGTKLIADTLATAHASPKQEHTSLHKSVTLDHWLEVKTLQICQVPLEARLVLSLVGREQVEKGERGEQTGESFKFTELGWASLQMFSHDHRLAQGAFLLPVWPVEANQQIGPAPDPGSHPRAETCPLVSVELPELGGPVLFPTDIQSLPGNKNISFDQLDKRTQQQLEDFSEQDILSFNQRPPLDRELLWEKRHYLAGVPGALPKVLLAVQSWDPVSLPSLYGLLESWPRPDTIDVLQLFLPIFPDTRVRSTAVSWLASLPTDELVDFLPQLVEAVKHETWSASPLSRLLVERSLSSPRVAHTLYWLLTQALPGLSPQNSLENSSPVGLTQISVARYHRRLQLLLRAVFAVAGDAVRQRFLAQQVLMKNLSEAAVQVQGAKDGKQVVLVRHMEQLHHQLSLCPTLVPLYPSMMADGVDVRNCSYFNSNTFPLKLVLSSVEKDVANCTLKTIFKVGDDLRQDMLTLQMIRVIDRLWLKAGLDLRMVSFRCVPTGWKAGVVEFVEDASTLRDIQVADNSVTGSLTKPEVVNDWLLKHNQSPLDFKSAVNNFTRSCAGYSVVTYILGICDRHNDNIMVKTSGHLFHIDFGKFLGDAQKFGSIKRDRVPFVLTPDMVFVINGGDKMTERFHTFVDLCCQAFNSLRASGNLLLTLFALMASSGIPGVTKEAVSYVQQRLFLDLSNAEAAARFSQLINESMKSVSTQFNFFVHNLAQLKFGTDGTSDSESLSFIPKKYNMAGEGRIVAVEVHGIQKRYDQEKYYVFILKVCRAGQKHPTYIFRTYKEFFEFHSKLCLLYPLTKFTSLTKGLSIGRSEVREVAERRKNEIGAFLSSLFRLSDEISHSDLVYTFFHPLHRDQEEADIHIQKLKEPKGGERRPSVGRICGKLKLSISYKQDTLLVMIHHIQNLSFSDPSREEPNSYVKVYLQPDPTKQTKRKTKIVKKNCNPSFMEMLEYRIPLDVVRCRTLQATVWDNSQFQENMFLGSVTINLGKLNLLEGIEEWYSLGQFQR